MLKYVLIDKLRSKGETIKNMYELSYFNGCYDEPSQKIEACCSEVAVKKFKNGQKIAKNTRVIYAYNKNEEEEVMA